MSVLTLNTHPFSIDIRTVLGTRVTTCIVAGAMRRLLLLPIKRWQALSIEATEDEPNNLLMAGLSPAPGKEGFHRLRSGAAHRKKGTPPLSTLGRDAGKSWEKLSSFFG